MEKQRVVAVFASKKETAAAVHPKMDDSRSILSVLYGVTVALTLDCVDNPKFAGCCTVIVVFPGATGVKFGVTVSVPPEIATGLGMVPAPGFVLVRVTLSEKPPRSGCVPSGFPAASTWAVDRKNGDGPAATDVLKLRPVGDVSTRPDAVSVMVAVFGLYPGAVAV